MHFFHRHRKTVLIGSLVAGVLGSSFGFAATTRDGPPMGRMYKNLEKLRADLNLNPNQVELWQKASNEMKSTAQQAMANHRQMREQFNAALDTPNLDLRALAEKNDKLRADAQAARKQVRDSWLAVYESLDPAQRETVRAFLKERAARMAKWQEHRRHRDGAA